MLESLIAHSERPRLVSKVDQAVISSVVPNLSRALQKNIIRLFNIQPLMVTLDVKAGLARETIPPELGTDILCNLAWGHHLHPDMPVAIVDFGTALTISCVGADGDVIGAAIAPGLVTAVNALFGQTAQLPQVELKIPKVSMGRTTDESIRSGIMLGYAGLVESMIARTEKQIGGKLHVMATGGLSKTIASLIPCLDEVDPLHTLNGLKLINDLNQRQVSK
jgi:type III pantothenate kinase